MTPSTGAEGTSYEDLRCSNCKNGEHEYCDAPYATGDATFATGGQHLVEECCCTSDIEPDYEGMVAR